MAVELPSPVITAVSYDQSINQYIIYWSQDSLTKVGGFDIYRLNRVQFNKPYWDVIDSVLSNTIFKRSLPDSSKVNFYAVEAFPNQAAKNLGYGASQQNSLKMPWQNAPNNILLSGSFDACSYTINLNWNKYYGWAPTQEVYKIWYKTKHGKYKQITSNDYDITNAQDTSINLPANQQYNNFTFSLDSVYYFYAKVYSGDANNTNICASNIVSINTTADKAPAYITPLGSEVSSDNSTIKLKYKIDPTSQLTKFYISSSLYPDKAFAVIDTGSFSKGSDRVNAIIAYKDTLKYYRLDLFNNCSGARQSVVISSGVQSNVLLRAKATSNSFDLTWTDEENDSISFYEVHRQIGNSDSVIGTTTNTNFSEQISNFNNITPGMPINYYVKAFYKNTEKNSISNTQTVYLPGGEIMPGFFTPNGDGRNDYFYPIVPPTKMHLIIYDRMGAKVYETNSSGTDGAWDGNYYPSGGKAPQGVYIYYVKLTTKEGKTIEKNGTVTLIRQ